MMTIKIGRNWRCSAALWLLLAAPAQAQLPQTRLNALFPSGGMVGSEFEVALTAGEDLEEVAALEFSSPHAAARPKTVFRDGAETVIPNVFVVKIAPEAAPGVCDVRCSGLWGCSNPRRFVIGELAEILETQGPRAAATALPAVLNAVINGCVSAPGEVDWYRFAAKQGQRVILDCWARRMDSRLAPVLSIYDAGGRRRLAATPPAPISDPCLVFDVPADGDYLIKLHDLTFRHGAEFGYRLEVHARPYLEAAYPSAGAAGQSQTVRLYGYNLPGGTRLPATGREPPLEQLDVEMTFPSQTDSLSAELPIPPAGAGLDGCSYRLPGRPTSNPIQLGLTTLPLVREQEPNDQLTGAPLVELPVEIAGQFERPGDQDVFRFHAQAGQTLWLDAIADRQGGRADPVLIVQRITTCPSGEEQIAALASADDDGRSLNQHAFDTRSADPQLRVDIREDGWYQALLRDRYWESRGGPEFCYRLRIHAGAPDFRVVAVPGAPQQSQIAPLSLRRGDRQAITFYAFRRDGFDGPISITPVNLPAGIACEEVQIDPGAALGTAILSAAEDAVPGPAELQFRATAPGPEGGLLSHPVRGATVLWGAQGVSPALCRVVDHLTLAVMHEAAPWQLAGGTKEIQAWQGSSAVLPVSLQRRGDCQDAVRLHVQNLPEQASIDGPAVIPREVAAGEVRLAVRETAPPGRYQLLVQGEADVSYRRNPQAAERAQARHEQARQRADQLRLEAEEASKRKNESQRLLSLAQRAVQQTQAALGQSAQQLDQARQQAGKADMASRQTGQTLAAAEQQLALANQKLSAAEARRRTGDDAFAPLEAAAQQADRTVADLRAEIAELQAAAQKLETEPPPSGTDESASAADKTNSPLDAAQARLPDLLETQRLARQRRDDMKPGWTAARAEFDAASKEQSSAMGAHDEAFRIHEAARQAAALQQQALLTADQAHRVALQAFNQAQGEAMAAERVRLKSEADEKSAWASAHAAEETRRLARQQANDAAQAAEPRHLVFAAPGASIALTILAAPLRLTAEADQDGSVQQGASLAVRVRLERQPSFDQPVLLTLAGAEAEGRISAPAVFVPSGDREATLLIRVAPEAAPGPYPNCVIRAVLDPATGTGVEAPVCLQVRSAAPTRPVETSQRTE